MEQIINFSKEAFTAYTEQLKKTFSTIPQQALSLGETEYIKIETNLKDIDSVIAQFVIRGSYNGNCVESYVVWNCVQPSTSYVYNIGDIFINESYQDVVDDKIVFYFQFSSPIDSLVIDYQLYKGAEPLYKPIVSIVIGSPAAEATRLSSIGVIKNFEDKNQFIIATLLDANTITGTSKNVKFQNEEGEEISAITLNPNETANVTIVSDGVLDFLSITPSDGILINYQAPLMTISATKPGNIVVSSTINSNMDNLQILIQE